MGQIWGYFNVELGYEIGLIWVVSLREKLRADLGLFLGEFQGGNRGFGWGKLVQNWENFKLKSRVTGAIFQDGRCNCKSLKHGTRWRCP